MHVQLLHIISLEKITKTITSYPPDQFYNCFVRRSSRSSIYLHRDQTVFSVHS